MREAGLSNRFCLSVSLSVCQSVMRKKLKSRHIEPHKPSKGSQTIANSKKLLYVYLTEVKVLRFAVFRLFPTFHNYSLTLAPPLRDLRVPSRKGVHLMTATKQCFLTIYVLHRHRGYRFGCFFYSYLLLFVTFGPTSSASQ